MTTPVHPETAEGAQGRVGGTPHCATCHCGRWAPVNGRRGELVVSWPEHLKVWEGYAAEGHGSQDAERIAQRGGFSVQEMTKYLGHAPETVRPARGAS